MKSRTPDSPSSQVRISTALFIAFLIFLTPIMPVASASIKFAGYVNPNASEANIRQTGKGAATKGGVLGLLWPLTAIVSATKADSFPDPNSDGKAEPGDTITYDVNISNSGGTDAAGVTFNDTIDPNTTLVGGSLKVSPLAFADSFNATKDIPLSISAPGLLANDTGTPSPTAVPIAGGSTSQGGSITLQSDGSFSYTPASGFTGTDTFTYTVTNGLSPDDTATVTINVDQGPTVTSTSPAPGAINIATNSNITINFSEPVNATTGSFSIECGGGSPQSYSLSASPAASFTLDPAVDLPAGTTCTVTVIANQITDADTNDPPDQLAADYVFSFGVKPDAVDDMHSATGNVRINTAASGFSVLANDMGPGIAITSFDSTSVHGGSVTMNTVTGTFTYNPPRGFTGTDSFTYTISNAAGSDQGTVVLTVSDMIWFINSSAGACSSSCDGRLTNPYTSLAAFEAANGNGTISGGTVVDPEAGDHIFIYTGAGDYNGPLTLENNQRVIGQGASSDIPTLAGITLANDSDALPTTGGANPVITNSSGGGISLAQNNNLHGLSVTNTTGTGISGNGFGTLTVSENVILSNTATAGTPISLSNGDLAATFKSISAGNNNANPDPVNGIVLSNTTGSFTVTGNSSGICGGQVTASLTAGAPASTLNPNEADCTGGTIQSTSGRGVWLTNATNISLTRMLIKNNLGDGIYGSNVTGFSLISSSVDNNADDAATDEAGLKFDNLLGTSSIINSTVANSLEDNARIFNTSGTLTSLTIAGSTFRDTEAISPGNNGLILQADGSANMTATITNSAFLRNRSNGLQVINNTSTGLMDVTIGSGSTNSGGTFADNNIGVNIGHNSTGTLKFDIINGVFHAPTRVGTGSPININMGTQARNMMSGTISGNRITNNNSTAGPGIRVISNGNDTVPPAQNILAVVISGNHISQVANRGIDMLARDGNNSIEATITGNTITLTDPSSADGIRVDSGALTADTTKICADITGNTSTTVAGLNGIRVRQRFLNTTFRLPGYAGNPLDDAAVAAFLSANNNGAVSLADHGGSGFGGGAACTPPVALLNYELKGKDALALNAAENSNDAQPSVASSITGGELAAAYNNVTAISPAASALNNATLKEPVAASYSLMGGERLLAHNRKPRAIKQALKASGPRLINLQPSGETVNASIGTLPASKTVRVQFQVTVNDPLPSGVTQVSNQGTVSGSNITTIQTDDPAAGGSSDPTVTLILTPPGIAIKDASATEPSSGQAPAAFAVTLSHAFSQPVTVSFITATGGANPATAGTDYTTTSGTLTFNPGQTVQTISVPVLADADTAEGAETFLVNISGATNGVITDGQAIGTINPNGTPGTVLISELRTSGPAGADDDFVELLNNTDSDITVQASDTSTGWALVKSGAGCSDTPEVIAVIPNGTVIPARGNYLVTGLTYSLGLYAAGDQPMTVNIEDDRNVALFNTADLANLQTSTRLDAVGFGTNTGNNCDLLREGTNLQAAMGSLSEHSFVRKVDKGETLDANDNSADFQVVSTTPSNPVGSNLTPTLGAPGPESSSSPRGPVPCSETGTASLDRASLDASQGVGSAPNTVRDTTSDAPNNSTFGTLDFRRRFTNNSGGAITRLRFRIVDMSTKPSAGGTADLRARTSTPITVTGVNDSATCGGSTPCNVLVLGTTLETPPAQLNGGGVNSTLAVGTVTLATPLAGGSSLNLRFLFGVEQEGDYRIGVVLETLTAGSLGQDIWVLRGNTQTGDHSDGDCNAPPVANAGADQQVECAGALTGVTLDGTQSSDPDGDTPLTYEWREGATVLGTGSTLNTQLAFGSHIITLKVTDPSGAFSEDTLTVDVVDNSEPSITAPPNVSVSTGPGATSCDVYISDATLGAASATDGCSATVTITRTGVPAGNLFPVGQTVITYTADDGHGNTKNAMQIVTVTDNTPPTLSVPADITTDAPANSCSANVNPGTATASDNCASVTVTGTRSDSQPLNAPYPVGVTTITWKATDGANNMTTGTQTITVKDAQAPVITLTSGTITLGPPNHQYQTFTIANLVASASDLCDTSVDINDVVISQVTSDEPEDANGNGDGHTLNDIVITPDCKSVQLRRERAGGGNGRIYTITMMVKDSSGNTATAVRQVVVSNGGPVIDSGASYTVNGCAP